MRVIWKSENIYINSRYIRGIFYLIWLDTLSGKSSMKKVPKVDQVSKTMNCVTLLMWQRSRLERESWTISFMKTCKVFRMNNCK